MSLADTALRQGLHRVGARPPLWAYLRQAWQRRDFTYAMARFKVQASNERNRLGMLWVVLQPIINAAIYGLIFGLLQGDSRPEDFVQFIVIGVFLFQFFTSCMTNGAKSITGNSALVQSLAFPRITLPFSIIIEQLLNLVPTLGVMVVFLLATGHYPTWSWLLMIPLLVLFAMVTTGVALIGARLTVHLRDLSQFLPYISRILFYTSGVLFAPEKILANYPSLLALYDYHPLHEVLSLARSLLIGAEGAEPLYWAYLSAWSVGLLVIGVLFFWVAEERYGRVD
ncbi:ABC transporter permease [Auraticoccus monumenti]|uniref:Transport permease protein n=1 Tax=Auraticoccus monumenti TaxID=675864 RepID=A0A1G7C695_9ACTN|nr:ABC transporter permease [Auraticoccus monumenti]SDE34819.1 teichoic acid transport system permease protein [Auraticoccus monumenti]